MKLTEPLTFLRLSFGLPCQKRKVESSGPGDFLDGLAPDAGRVDTTVSLWSKDAFKAIAKNRAAFKSLIFDRVKGLGLPTKILPGVCVLPGRLDARADAILSELQASDSEQVRQFGTLRYDIEKTRAKLELKASFDEKDYPEWDKLAQSFRVNYFKFRLEPTGASSEQLTAALGDVAGDCRAALREGLADCVGRLVEVLTPGADGKSKKLYDSAVDNLRTFLGLLNARDITDDQDIRALADKARAVIGDTTMGAIRESATAQSRIRDGLAGVATAAAGLVKETGSRSFFLDDE